MGSSNAWIRRSMACTSSNCIDQVEAGTPEEADILRGQEFVVAGVGVCNATTARCHALEPPS